MNYKAFFFSRYNINVLIIVLLLVNFCFGQLANAAEAFQIKGYYLGATPAELGITVDSDFDQEEQSYEVVGAGNVSLFFVRVGDKLRVYRILKEEVVSKENMESTLNDLKVKYGVPEMQHIEASYFKASPKIMKYTLSATNRASWNITESQEFIAWIEQGRILYELLDHEPQKVKTVPKPASTAEGEEPVGDKPEGDGWETDF
jgi:hypothetical protein